LLGPAKNSFLQAQQLNPHSSEADLALVRAFPKRGSGRACAAGAGNFSSTDEHKKPESTFVPPPKEFDAFRSASGGRGCRPRFAVNGEIIIADEDALTEDEITAMADQPAEGEQQREKIQRGMRELCISLLHSVAGRVRATFYRRNGHPEMSLRFCGDKVPRARNSACRRKLMICRAKPNGLVLITGPTAGGQNDDAQLSGQPD